MHMERFRKILSLLTIIWLLIAIIAGMVIGVLFTVIALYGDKLISTFAHVSLFIVIILSLINLVTLKKYRSIPSKWPMIVGSGGLFFLYYLVLDLLSMLIDMGDDFRFNLLTFITPSVIVFIGMMNRKKFLQEK